MNIHFIKSKEKKKIVEKLQEKYGISELPYLLIKSGKEKTRAFSGNLNKEEIQKLSEIARIEVMGLYIIKEEHDLRLSLDATHLLKEQISKNIIEINEEQAMSWMKGQDLEIKVPRETVVIKYGDSFLGCGKSNGEKIFNYVPKDRRAKK